MICFLFDGGGSFSWFIRSKVQFLLFLSIKNTRFDLPVVKWRKTINCFLFWLIFFSMTFGVVSVLVLVLCLV